MTASHVSTSTTSTPALRVAPVLLLAAVACTQQGNPVGPGSNRAPVIRKVTVVPGAVLQGGRATIAVDASDPDGDPVFYRYAAESGVITPDKDKPWNAVYVNTAGAGTGEDRLTISVIDARNAPSSFIATVGLRGNQGPIVQLSQPGPCHPTCRSSSFDNCNPICTLSFVATARDPEGDALSYEWKGCIDESSGNRGSCRVTTPGEYTAIVVVRDAHGGASVASATAAGVNRAPFVSGGGTFVGHERRLLINASDPDGDPVKCFWSGNCLCVGDTQSSNLTCSVPVTAASCFQVASCLDPFGARGETRFDLVRP